MKVGDAAVHVERLAFRNTLCKIRAVMIKRETKTQWIDDNGSRWRKSDGARVPQYASGPRYLMSVEDFEKKSSEGEAS